MCWSFNVSLTASIFEACLITFITIRSIRSSDPRLHQQLFILPALVSVLMVEIIETILWSNLSDVPAIEDADSTKCQELNKYLTLIIWTFILPLQPFALVFGCRRSGSPNNYRIFQVPEFTTIMFAVANWAMLLYVNFTKDAQLNHSNQVGYMNNQTCTYIGPHGHLHWTVKAVESALNPNILLYALLWIQVVFARPLKFLAAPALLMLLVFFAQSLYFQGSFEAGSMWCLTALVTFVYFAIQPYAFPTKLVEHNTTIGNEKLRYLFLPTERIKSGNDRCHRYDLT